MKYTFKQQQQQIKKKAGLPNLARKEKPISSLDKNIPKFLKYSILIFKVK